MNAIVKILIVLALFTSTAHSGPVGAGVCVTGCNCVYASCVAGAGGVTAVTTGGLGVPAAIVGCNTAYSACMGGCVVAGFLPTL